MENSNLVRQFSHGHLSNLHRTYSKVDNIVLVKYWLRTDQLSWIRQGFAGWYEITSTINPYFVNKKPKEFIEHLVSRVNKSKLTGRDGFEENTSYDRDIDGGRLNKDNI